MNHSFNVDLAVEVGIIPATIFESIAFWVDRNMKNGSHFHDGRYWVFNTVDAWSELFPYATRRQVEKALKTLRDSGYIIAGNYNEDRRIRTLWYALTDRGLEVAGMIANTHTCECNMPDGGIHSTTGRIDYINNTVTSTSVTSTDIGAFTQSEPNSEKKPKKKFVPPTPDEVREYARSRNYSLDAEYFCAYYEANDWKRVDGTPISNWKQCVLTWQQNESRRQSSKQTQISSDSFADIGFGR